MKRREREWRAGREAGGWAGGQAGEQAGRRAGRRRAGRQAGGQENVNQETSFVPHVLSEFEVRYPLRPSSSTSQAGRIDLVLAGYTKVNLPHRKPTSGCSSISGGTEHKAWPTRCSVAAGRPVGSTLRW